MKSLKKKIKKGTNKTAFLKTLINVKKKLKTKAKLSSLNKKILFFNLIYKNQYIERNLKKKYKKSKLRVKMVLRNKRYTRKKINPKFRLKIRKKANLTVKYNSVMLFNKRLITQISLLYSA